MAFQKATRKRAFIKIAVTGASGGGKTLSSLLLAYGITGDWSKVAIADTENGSAHLYADRGDYSVLEISAPFTTKKYQDAIDEAVEAGFEVLILDSLTHEWAGEGGLLQQKEALDARGGSNKFTNWGNITKSHEQFKAQLLQSPIHIIGTMRSKTEYAIGTDNKPQKIGTAPIQRDGMEYEFSIVLDVLPSHDAYATKDRTGLFASLSEPISAKHGKMLREWMDSGAVVAPDVTPDPAHTAALAAVSALFKPLTKERVTFWKEDLKSGHGHSNLVELTTDQLNTFAKRVKDVESETPAEALPSTSELETPADGPFADPAKKGK